MAHDVFISYSTKDKNISDAICSLLEQNKIRCWIAPRDIIPGKTYAASITEAIRSSKIMVVVFSNNSNISNPVMNELELATKYVVNIIPFRIEEVNPSDALEYYLSSKHWLDAITPPLEEHIFKLVNTIQSLLPFSKTLEDKTDEGNDDNKTLDENMKNGSEEESGNNTIDKNDILQKDENIEKVNAADEVEYIKSKDNINHDNWKVDVIDKSKTKRELKVYLTSAVHRIELEYFIWSWNKHHIKIDGEIVDVGKGSFKSSFSIKDGEEQYPAVISFDKSMGESVTNVNFIINDNVVYQEKGEKIIFRLGQ